MVITWKKFIFGVIAGIAVLIVLSVMKGEPVFFIKKHCHHSWGTHLL